jgi:hypothetical protein
MVGGKCALLSCQLLWMSLWTLIDDLPIVIFIYGQGIILYIMVTGFPPYDIPTTEDERYDIICQGGLMRQLRAWDSKYFL